MDILIKIKNVWNVKKIAKFVAIRPLVNNALIILFFRKKNVNKNVLINFIKKDNIV